MESQLAENFGDAVLAKVYEMKADGQDEFASDVLLAACCLLKQGDVNLTDISKKNFDEAFSGLKGMGEKRPAIEAEIKNIALNLK